MTNLEKALEQIRTAYPNNSYVIRNVISDIVKWTGWDTIICKRSYSDSEYQMLIKRDYKDIESATTDAELTAIVASIIDDQEGLLQGSTRI